MAKITFEDKNKFAGQPFNQLKAAEVNEIKESVNALYDGVAGYLVVTELPATIPQGVQLLYNGTMYRGLLEGESSLAAGTPWPVKGYKEFALYVEANFDDETVSVENLISNTMGLVYELQEPPTSILIEEFPFLERILINIDVFSYDVVGASRAIEKSGNDLIILATPNTGATDFNITTSVSVKLYPPAP